MTKVLFVSRERFKLPLDETQRRKWDAIGELLDYRVLAAAQAGSSTEAERFSLAAPSPAFDGPLYYARLPRRIARELRAFRPDVVSVQGVHEANAVLTARRLAGVDAKLVLDVQGDWHAATRLYGSPARRLLNPLSDAMARIAVRNADAIRTLSPFTSALVRRYGREPAGEFIPFVDRDVFLARPPAPLPSSPRALFVGVLERYKGFDALVAAWPRVAEAVPDAELHVVGRGTLAHLAGQFRRTESLDAAGVAAAIDESTLLCLPSRAEGLGRVVVEAMCRGRAVVGGTPAAFPTSSRTASPGCSCRQATPPRSPTRSSASSATAASPSGSAPPRGAGARS